MFRKLAETNILEEIYRGYFVRQNFIIKSLKSYRKVLTVSYKSLNESLLH